MCPLTLLSLSAQERFVLIQATGLPKWRPRLPSRNWLIFLSVTGTFTAAVMYDRREKRRVQRKWADTVSHLAEEHLSPNTMPRRIRIFVQAPPADGMMPVRELFYEYVKPILVAGALDWEVVEARREGDVRWAVAEGIRKKRRKAGEGVPEEEQLDAIAFARERAGTTDWDGVNGDLVIGRHTWKEYIRGLHEGWLGPVDKPAEVVVETVDAPVEKGPDGHSHTTISDAAVETLKDVVENATEDKEAKEPTAEEKKKQEEKEEEEKRKKLYKPDPYISILDYANTTLPRSIPEQLGPSAVIPFNHILGLFNTPIRVWRFLHKRNMADDIGRQTAALVLASASRPLDIHADEPQGLLKHEESEWHKSVRKREIEQGKEDLWRDPVTLDERIAERMRMFELNSEDEQRAAQFWAQPKEANSIKSDES